MSYLQSRILTIAGGGTVREEVLRKPVPTVFIGLGGSGKDVLMRLRKRFFDRFQTRDPGYARFVFVDTDTQDFVPRGENSEPYAELTPSQSELVPCPITQAQFQKVFADLNARVNCDHLGWLKREMEKVGAGAVAKGAGTHRQFGRLAFFLNYQGIRHTIERQVAATLQYAAENPTKVEENRVEVVIVMSVAGGTGAGMFIDVAYLVQDILNEPNYRTLVEKNVTLVGFLPGIFEEQSKDLYPRFQQNAFAALMELEYYGTPRTGDELFLGEIRNGTQDDRHWAGFRADWGDGRKRFIRGPGWDSCFLIDSRNDLDPNAPLTTAEVFQMAADYLFLDFENHEFAIAKRSNRSNLVQCKDKVKETWVRRPDSHQAVTEMFESNSVYATQNGCRFSSFGLAEIYFDVEKLYQVASYRLASLLVRSRWLGDADAVPESQYTSWVRDDLFQPRAKPNEEAPPSFLPDRLGRYLVTSTTGCRLDDLKADTDALGQVEPDQGLERIGRVLSTHAGLLRDRGQGTDVGAARQTIAESLGRLSGDAINLGPLRKRLQRLAAGHNAADSVNVTLRLLDRYRVALNQVRERARSQAEATPPGDQQLLARLREAEQVPWPVHDMAVSIEYGRARGEVARALQLRYDKATAPSIDSLLKDVSRYIGGADQTTPADLARHGTLHGYYTRVQTVWRAIAERLEERFKVSHGDDRPRITERVKVAREERASPVTRRYSLSPNWDEATYDRRIDEALVGHPSVKRAASPGEKFTFDWGKFEELVLRQLRNSPRAELGEVHNSDDLVRHWVENKQTDADGIKKVAELLADACQVVLHGDKDAGGEHSGGFQLRDEEDGNAVDLLVRSPDWAEVLDRMVKASMPYFQTTDPTRISHDFSPAYSNLYSQKEGERNPKVSARNAEKVYEKVREIAASRGQSNTNPASRQIARPLAAENSSIILVREMTGFPLQFYAKLEELHRAYETTTTITRKNDECHINFKEASEDLPDITLLETETYALIRDNVAYVVRAIVLQAINWREGVLKVMVPDPYTPSGVEIRLGTRLHRAIKYACEQDRVRRYLAHFWNDWTAAATPKHWACLYASGRMTWYQLHPERDVRQGEVSSPLRNCYDNLLAQARERLRASDEGKRWLAALEPDRFDERTAEGVPGSEPTLATRLAQTCLRRLSPEIPIYQVIAEKVGDIHLPD